MLHVLEVLGRKFISNPPVIAAVVVAAINTTTVGDQSWQGYATAILVALVRQFTKPYWDLRK